MLYLSVASKQARYYNRRALMSCGRRFPNRLVHWRNSLLILIASLPAIRSLRNRTAKRTTLFLHAGSPFELRSDRSLVAYYSVFCLCLLLGAFLVDTITRQNTTNAQGNGYTYRRTITIDHTKVPNTDQSNFPVLISGTYSFLKTVGNGGNVQNANGYDVIFTLDSTCGTKLNHEVETYNASTGAVNYWVKVPTLSHTSDTTVYLCYGNASISTDQSNKSAVWDANYKGVWHLPNGSTLNA